MIRPGESAPEDASDGSYDVVMAKLRSGKPITDGEFRKLQRMVDHLTAQARMAARAKREQSGPSGPGPQTIMGLPVVPAPPRTRDSAPHFRTNIELFQWLMLYGNDGSLPLQPITQYRLCYE